MRTPTSPPTSIDEPVRLRDEQGGLGSLEQALLRAGSSYRTTQQTRVKVLAGLGLAGSTLLGGTAAASVSSAAKLTWTKLLLGASLVGVTAVPVGYYALHGADAPAKRAAVSASVVSDSMAAQAAAAHDATLTAELGALDRARVSLANGQTRRAVDELDTYERGFPNGRLQIEAEVLRIDALARLGRRDAARQRADVFLRRHPNSVLATRVRALLVD